MMQPQPVVRAGIRALQAGRMSVVPGFWQQGHHCLDVGHSTSVSSEPDGAGDGSLRGRQRGLLPQGKGPRCVPKGREATRAPDRTFIV